MILLLITDYCTYMYNLLHVQILQITTKIKMYILKINNYSCKNCISVLKLKLCTCTILLRTTSVLLVYANVYKIPCPGMCNW